MNKKDTTAVDLLQEELQRVMKQRDHAVEVARYWYQAWLHGDRSAASKRPAWAPDDDNPQWLDRSSPTHG